MNKKISEFYFLKSFNTKFLNLIIQNKMSSELTKAHFISKIENTSTRKLYSKSTVKLYQSYYTVKSSLNLFYIRGGFFSFFTNNNNNNKHCTSKYYSILI